MKEFRNNGLPTINLSMVHIHQRIGQLLKELELNPEDESILSELDELNFDPVKRCFKPAAQY